MAEANIHWRVPAVDIFESDDSFKLLADLPRIHKDDLEITIHQGKLKLRAVTGENGFERVFSLPDGFDGEVSAALHSGVLTVTLPKPAAARPQRIAVA